MYLEEIRDLWTNSFTYFWRNEKWVIVSPYFDSERDAYLWLEENPQPIDNPPK